MLEEHDLWERGPDDWCSGHSAYDFNYNCNGDRTIASMMLFIFATTGRKTKPKKKKGNGKSKPAPEKDLSLGGSETPQQQ